MLVAASSAVLLLFSEHTTQQISRLTESSLLFEQLRAHEDALLYSRYDTSYAFAKPVPSVEQLHGLPTELSPRVSRMPWGYFDLVHVTSRIGPRILSSVRLVGSAPTQRADYLQVSRAGSADVYAAPGSQIAVPVLGATIIPDPDSEALPGVGPAVLSGGQQRDTLRTHPQAKWRVEDSPRGRKVLTGDAAWLQPPVELVGHDLYFGEGDSLVGKTIVNATGRVSISAQAYLDNVLVVAKEIVLARGARVRGQFVANQSILVGQDVRLGAPSILALRPTSAHDTTRVTFGEGSVLSGGIYVAQTSSLWTSTVQLLPGSRVSGYVVTPGLLDNQGIIEGYCHSGQLARVAEGGVTTGYLNGGHFLPLATATAQTMGPVIRTSNPTQRPCVHPIL